MVRSGHWGLPVAASTPSKGTCIPCPETDHPKALPIQQMRHSTFPLESTTLPLPELPPTTELADGTTLLFSTYFKLEGVFLSVDEVHPAFLSMQPRNMMGSAFQIYVASSFCHRFFCVKRE